MKLRDRCHGRALELKRDPNAIDRVDEIFECAEVDLNVVVGLDSKFDRIVEIKPFGSSVSNALLIRPRPRRGEHTDHGNDSAAMAPVSVFTLHI